MAIPLEHSQDQKPEALLSQPAAWSAATIRSLLVGTLLLAVFWPILYGIYRSWFDPGIYMEHGLLVVPTAVYMVWTQRDKLKSIALRPSGWGLVLLIGGALEAALGLLAHWIWFTRTAFLISLVGSIALVFGFSMVRALSYPLATLVLMIAPPTFVFASATLHLQLLASRLGAAGLDWLGYSVLRDGNVLEMVGIKLSVAEACSGIRSLLAIIFICVLYNYFFVNGRSMKTVILLMSVPIAILGNAGRIVATGIAGQYDSSLVEGATHEAFGYVSVALAAAGCIGLHWVLQHLQKMRRSKHA
ncbi:MAG TPA: exosortase/archaeosortase family protein [Bryobacteraceae bacterium]|nr:exosortase/archaeosortase family protein [Bryobacteraceae bacterium]